MTIIKCLILLNKVISTSSSSAHIVLDLRFLIWGFGESWTIVHDITSRSAYVFLNVICWQFRRSPTVWLQFERKSFWLPGLGFGETWGSIACSSVQISSALIIRHILSVFKAILPAANAFPSIRSHNRPTTIRRKLPFCKLFLRRLANYLTAVCDWDWVTEWDLIRDKSPQLLDHDKLGWISYAPWLSGKSSAL